MMIHNMQGNATAEIYSNSAALFDDDEIQGSDAAVNLQGSDSTQTFEG